MREPDCIIRRVDYTADPANGFQVYKPEIKLIKIIFCYLFNNVSDFILFSHGYNELRADKKIYVKRKLANLLLAKIASPGRWQL